MSNRFLLIIFLLTSCSSIKTPQTSAQNQNLITEQVQAVKSEADITNAEKTSSRLRQTCDGCMRGSFYFTESEGEQTNNKKVYKLTDTGDYSLKNTDFDISILLNKETDRWIKYFVTKGRNSLLEYLELSGRYAPVMGEMLEQRGMPRDLIFLAMAESGFQNRAKSKARAVGPWQFIQATGKKFGLRINWYVDERRDPLKATIAASNYLSDLMEMFGSWEMAQAAYNAGEGKIARAVKKYSSDDFWEIRGGRYLKKETKNYVPKIMALAIIGKNLTTFGFEEVAFKDPLEYEVIDLPSFVDLKLLAEKLEWSFEDLQQWNPELLRWFTPPQEKYSLRLPIGLKAKFESNVDISQMRFKNFQEVKLQNRMQLVALAKKKHLPLPVLQELNSSNVASNVYLLPFRVGDRPNEKMYADLFEERGKSKLHNSRMRFRDHIISAKNKGAIVLKGKMYTIRKGDTLWEVAKKTGTSLETLIRGNLSAVEDGLKPGEKLYTNN
jgi:membrane-bound lytic murein transglycosylase D